MARIASSPAGTFEGVERESGVSWLGIRFARAERFGEPQPVEPQREVRCATLGPVAPQPSAPLLPVAGAAMSDDCLTLNVHAPHPDGRARPVLVWIHGGAFQVGSGGAYDGAVLSHAGDLVVVTVNYRLGALGFADLSRFGVPRNLGLLDQLAALRWVRDNIAAFGGDPQRVTVAGESAGSISISLLLIAERARGLFAGAIMQSGALSLIHDSDRAAARGERWLALTGLTTLEALRAAPLDALIGAQRALEKELHGAVPSAPVFDGELLPESFAAAITTPTHDVPLLAGSNRDESRLFELPMLRGTLPRSRAEILERTRDQLGPAAALAVEGAYEAGRRGDRDLVTDATFGMPTRHFAEAHAAAGRPTRVYRFDLGGLLGATHGIELSYLWPLRGVLPTLALRGGPLVGRRRALAGRIRGHWAAFARDGDPGDWPRYTPQNRTVRIFDRRDKTVDDPDRVRREAWGGRIVGLAR